MEAKEQMISGSNTQSRELGGWGKAAIEAGCRGLTPLRGRLGLQETDVGIASGCTSGKRSPGMNYVQIILHLHRNFCLFTVEEHKEENLFHTWCLI